MTFRKVTQEDFHGYASSYYESQKPPSSLLSELAAQLLRASWPGLCRAVGHRFEPQSTKYRLCILSEYLNFSRISLLSSYVNEYYSWIFFLLSTPMAFVNGYLKTRVGLQTLY